MPCDYTLLPHPGIQTLSPYVPGKSAMQLANEQGISSIIKLASNENPLGCSHLAINALAGMTGQDIAAYPAPNIHPLRQKIANKLALTPDMIILGNGSDMIFPLIMTCFALHTNRHILLHDYAFISYAIHAQTLGIPVIKSSLNTHWQVDIDDLLNHCNQNTGVIFLANPNNPTGTPITQKNIERILDTIPKSTILVLDEAYFEYNNPLDSIDSITLLKQHPNLILTRTFSKAYGLAGLRLGYALASPDIISVLLRATPPFTVNQAALIAADAALEDQKFITETKNLNHEGLKQLTTAFQRMGITFIPTAGNFITIDCKKDAGPIYQKLQRHGIIVRPLHPYGMDNFLRITVGTSQQNSLFLDTLSTCIDS